ncbi:MAG: double-cubane-cluster-containing anaerobic reductase [Synergistales bacterium]|nr:double-cubane-cluster-containing anaerobic reductase [Synergistales bacterium]MDY6400996.1 double-cubane-cluster-containing anaerobic reductase [Synergistales bacterium]MDY6405138.1 double-cubane-cluster-containing anaerobic reductase [Synergistales bacterium]MDY6411075.1 double-cubane-cluster-containing anaerobic reductase [Synergistales bacterium]MDY6414897.1 double-cubane-cluster-containing anaerobic reductase [Synergistales bacterium]
MLSLPRNFESFNEARRKSFMALYNAKEQGKKIIGTFCSYTPVEIIYAAGAVSVGLCGKSEQGITEAEAHLPKTLCPLIKASYGMALTEQCPFFYFSDGILAETTCDGKKKMYELMNFLKPVHVMNLPQGRDQALALDSWTEEVKRAAKFLENLLNVKITEEKLHDAIVYRNRVRKAIVDLYEVAKLKPSPVSGYEISTVAESADFHFTDDDLVSKIERTTKEFKQRIRSDGAGRPRVLITGCPNAGVRDKIIKRLEELGADYVCADNCAGPRTQKFMIDENSEPYRAIAERYLKINCSVMTPNTARFDDIKALIQEYQVDGVIEIVLHGCHTFAVEAYTTMNIVQNELALPYMRLDTDFSQSDSGQIETRLGAFIEMMTAA